MSSEHSRIPDLKIAGFQLWIHNHDSEDWLNVTAHCGAEGADVWVTGSVIMLNDIIEFRKGCEKMIDGSLRDVRMTPLEPEINLSLEKVDDVGHIEFNVRITPDHMTQKHEFGFEIDQSYLSDIVRSCESIIKKAM